MKGFRLYKLLVTSTLFGIQTLAFSQKPWETYFSPKDLTNVGIYYYPEQWDKSQWERDLKNIAAMGFEFTHFGEFAWTAMEPREGEYSFGWLDTAVALAGKYNLKVIMCTPTATPPVWLTQKHPEVMVVNAQGRRMTHGSRQQASWSSEVYKDYASKITQKLAERYGKNPIVWGWQIDNEPSHYWTDDYSPAAQAHFKSYLKQKYTTIAALNHAWGTRFWSQTYSDFEEIVIPNTKELPAQSNPHATLDFKRFQAQEIANFVKNQSSILRSIVTKNQWITTNYIYYCEQTDPSLSTDLDLVSFTIYPAGGIDMGVGPQGFRMGNPDRIAFSNAYFQSIKGATGCMEIQPGQVNWGPDFNPQLLPGTVRLWLWHLFAGGNKFVCSYRYRQPLYGTEQYHHGMVQTDGITPSQGGKEYMQFINELKILRESRKTQSAKAIPSSLQAKKTGILFHMDNVWETDNQKQTTQWSYNAHIFKYVRCLQRLAAPIEFTQENQDWSSYPFLLAPAYQLMDAKLAERWEKYVRNGGHLILTCRTGQKDKNAHLWQAPYASPILNLVGGSLEGYDVLPNSYKAKVSTGKKTFEWNNWADIWKPNPQSETWASFADQFYAGKSAVLHRTIGKGSVTYIGVDSDEGALEMDILQTLYAKFSGQTAVLPEGVSVMYREGFWIAVNYSSDVQTISIPANAKILIGKPSLSPTEVVVWQE